jgi:hypothetical protein
MYDDKEWLDLSDEVKRQTIKYLKLMRRFQKDPTLLSSENKKWMLSNCDLPTYLIPNELLDDENLWL